MLDQSLDDLVQSKDNVRLGGKDIPRAFLKGLLVNLSVKELAKKSKKLGVVVSSSVLEISLNYWWDAQECVWLAGCPQKLAPHVIVECQNIHTICAIILEAKVGSGRIGNLSV
jgi:hypothetical protein